MTQHQHSTLCSLDLIAKPHDSRSERGIDLFSDLLLGGTLGIEKALALTVERLQRCLCASYVIVGAKLDRSRFASLADRHGAVRANCFGDSFRIRLFCRFNSRLRGFEIRTALIEQQIGTGDCLVVFSDCLLRGSVGGYR